ncbi:MAG: cell division protein FtsA [Bacteroidales bacterium]|jgi:cell division protein FtsA|nr:cell division protein FtsA [Bacteroidales bacterium]
MDSYIAAIDLGTTKIVTLVGEKTESGFRIVAYRETPSKGVMRGEVVNIQYVLESLLPSLEDIKKKESIEIKEVYVGIAGQNIKCLSQRERKNRGKADDLISEAEMEEMIKNVLNSRVSAGEKILHVIPQSFNVDDHMGVESACGMTGTLIEGDYKLFIGKLNSVEHSKHVINRAGLRLRELILEPVASAKAVLTEDEMELGVAMIDIGGGTTDLLIYHNNIIRHTAVIPFGGNAITEDLRQGCSVSIRNAEQMKIQYGSCYSEYAPENKTVIIPGIGGRDSREVAFRVIAGIIEARVEEIIEAIMYEIENSGYMDKLGAGIVITGGGSQLTNLRQFIKVKTGYDARIASPVNNISFDTAPEICKPEFSTAIGLIMLGAEYEKSRTDTTPSCMTLFPDEVIVVDSDYEKSIGKTTKKEKTTRKRGAFGRFPAIIGSIFDNTNNEA